MDKEEGGDSGIDANSQGSCSSTDAKSKEKRKDKKKKKTPLNNTNSKAEGTSHDSRTSASNTKGPNSEIKELISERRSIDKHENKNLRVNLPSLRKGLVFESTRHPAEREDFESTGNETYVSSKGKKQQ